MVPAEAQPFGAVFFEQRLRLFGGLDHLFGMGAPEARQLRDPHSESSTLSPVFVGRAVSRPLVVERYVLATNRTSRNFARLSFVGARSGRTHSARSLLDQRLQQF